MEEKAALRRELRSLQMEANNLAKTVSSKTKERDSLTQEASNAVAKAKASAEKEFRDSTQAKKDTVSRIIKQTREQVEGMIDSLPKKEVEEYAGKCEIQNVERILEEHYPKAFIQDYIAYNPISFKDEADVLQHFDYCEAAAANMRSGFNVTSAYTLIAKAISTVLDEGDSKAIGGAVLFLIAVIAGVVIYPGIVLSIYACVGTLSLVSGLINRKLFRNLYSIKLFMNHSFDEDKFQRDKQNIMSSVEDFLLEVEQSYLTDIDAERFTWDTEKEQIIRNRYTERSKQLSADIEDLRARHRSLGEQISEIERKLGDIAESEKRAAATAKDTYLSLDWRKQWLDKIFLGVEGTSIVRTHPLIQGNVLYYASSIDSLQNFMKLYAYQLLLKTHPDYLYQIFIDYRYMGGTMQQFLALPSRSFATCLESETISQKMEFIYNDMISRTLNILQTTSGIEEFNDIMSRYDAVGETLCVVHIFGLSQVSETLKYMLRNGAKVGYFFNVYLTVAELQQLGDDNFLEFFNDLYEIGEFSERRSSTVLKALIHPDS